VRADHVPTLPTRAGADEVADEASARRHADLKATFDRI